MDYEVRSRGNGALHISGLAIRTTGGGIDRGDYVTDWTFSPCSGLTRIGAFHYKWFATDDLGEAIAKVVSLGYRAKACNTCLDYAVAVMAA